MVEQLSELTEGPLKVYMIDKKGLILQSDAEEELKSVGDDILAIPSDLYLDTYPNGANSTVKANPIASLGVRFYGAERLFVFTKEFSESANFDDTQTFYSEMCIEIGLPSEI